MIVYPMGLPPHDEVHAMLTDTEDLDGKQDAKLVVPPARLCASVRSFFFF